MPPMPLLIIIFVITLIFLPLSLFRCRYWLRNTIIADYFFATPPLSYHYFSHCFHDYLMPLRWLPLAATPLPLISLPLSLSPHFRYAYAAAIARLFSFITLYCHASMLSISDAIDYAADDAISPPCCRFYAIYDFADALITDIFFADIIRCRWYFAFAIRHYIDMLIISPLRHWYSHWYAITDFHCFRW